jgi:hypothetical protein
MRQLLDLGWVERCDDSAQKVLALLRFFGCASPDQCETYLQRLAVQYRTSEAFTADDYALSAWLRQGERMAQELDCSPYEGDVFRRALQEARRLTTEAPMVFVPELQQLCGDAGVAVAFVHELPGIRASGAARWLTPSKALIQLDLRYKSDDQLWFSFFHEAGHILLHGKRQFFLEEREDALDNMEQEADAFASDVLIPAPAYRDFVQKAVFTSSAILTFAGKQGIAPGIVVGRLQHEHHVPFNALNGLKRKIVWADT